MFLFTFQQHFDAYQHLYQVNILTNLYNRYNIYIYSGADTGFFLTTAKNIYIYGRNNHLRP